MGPLEEDIRQIFTSEFDARPGWTVEDLLPKVTPSDYNTYWHAARASALAALALAKHLDEREEPASD
jgi:hypothetical protein